MTWLDLVELGLLALAVDFGIRIVRSDTRSANGRKRRGIDRWKHGRPNDPDAPGD